MKEVIVDGVSYSWRVEEKEWPNHSLCVFLSADENVLWAELHFIAPRILTPKVVFKAIKTVIAEKETAVESSENCFSGDLALVV